ncbi:L,D-transpeptidase family protein [Desulfovibrio sp. MES5]|uniref:L,D-transpeptidase Cds6 family protein n=1 Tax=Desulfovibrio sp. MES5 TaxID=1899016 RepID=UPI0025BA2D11|nr:L,D-transpeptidase family protein [Desulfovibrio sp. MES5]
MNCLPSSPARNWWPLRAEPASPVGRGAARRAAFRHLRIASLFAMRGLLGFMMALLCVLAPLSAYSAEWQPTLYNEGLPSHLVAVDKNRQTFMFFEKKSPFKLRYTYPCTTGQLPGDKQSLNDLRTPEGIYFVEYKIASGLDFKEYGGIAYTLNYPNPVDKLRGKTGHGIWIHSKGLGIEPLSTRGCVAIGLKEIDEVGPSLVPGTAVVLAEKLDETTMLQSDSGTARELRRLMQAWSNAWAARSDKMFEFYDAESYTKAMSESFAAFRLNKERLFKILSFVKIYNRKIHVLEGPGYWVTWSEQLYAASNLSSEGIRRLYWQRGKDKKFRIVGMEWTPRDLGMRAAYQRGQLVAEAPLQVVSDADSEAPQPPRLDMPEAAGDMTAEAAVTQAAAGNGKVPDKAASDKAAAESAPGKSVALSDPLVPRRSATPPPAEVNWGARPAMEDSARLAAEQRAAEELAQRQQAEEERLAQQAAEARAAAERALAEKAAAEKAAAEKAAQEAQALLLAQQQAAEKLAAEKLAAEKLAAEKLAAEKLAAEKLAAEKLAADKLAAEKLAAEKLVAEQQAAEQLAAEKLAADQRAAREQATQVPATQDAGLTPQVLAQLHQAVSGWGAALASRSPALADFYDHARYNREPGAPRGQSYNSAWRELEKHLGAPWLRYISRKPVFEVHGNLATSRCEELIASPGGFSEGIRTLWWRKGDDGDLRIVAAQFKPQELGLAADYLDQISGAVSETLEGWRKAWEAGKLDDYMAYYTSNAVQQGRWGAKNIRNQKEGLWGRVKPTLVQLSGLRLVVDKQGIRADMSQTYADSSGHSDRGTKTLLLQYDGKQWLIAREDWAPMPASTGNPTDVAQARGAEESRP